MTRIGIVTDGTCDLGPARAAELDVSMISLKVTFGDHTYRDWLDVESATGMVDIPVRVVDTHSMNYCCDQCHRGGLRGRHHQHRGCRHRDVYGSPGGRGRLHRRAMTADGHR